MTTSTHFIEIILKGKNYNELSVEHLSHMKFCSSDQLCTMVFIILQFIDPFVTSKQTLACAPVGLLGISSDGDDQRIFWGFEIFYSGIFFGTKIWLVVFWVA